MQESLTVVKTPTIQGEDFECHEYIIFSYFCSFIPLKIKLYKKVTNEKSETDPDKTDSLETYRKEKKNPTKENEQSNQLTVQV